MHNHRSWEQRRDRSQFDRVALDYPVASIEAPVNRHWLPRKQRASFSDSSGSQSQPRIRHPAKCAARIRSHHENHQNAHLFQGRARTEPDSDRRTSKITRLRPSDFPSGNARSAKLACIFLLSGIRTLLHVEAPGSLQGSAARKSNAFQGSKTHPAISRGKHSRSGCTHLYGASTPRNVKA